MHTDAHACYRHANFVPITGGSVPHAHHIHAGSQQVQLRSSHRNLAQRLHVCRHLFGYHPNLLFSVPPSSRNNFCTNFDPFSEKSVGQWQLIPYRFCQLCAAKSLSSCHPGSLLEFYCKLPDDSVHCFLLLNVRPLLTDGRLIVLRFSGLGGETHCCW
jgi:hypothetical protein